MIVLMLHVERILAKFDFYHQSWPHVIGAVVVVGFLSFFLFLYCCRDISDQIMRLKKYKQRESLRG